MSKWDDIIARQTGKQTWEVTRPLAPGWRITEMLAQRCAGDEWVRTCDVIGTDMDPSGEMHTSECCGYIYPVTDRYAAAWLTMYFPDITTAQEVGSPEQAPDSLPPFEVEASRVYERETGRQRPADAPSSVSITPASPENPSPDISTEQE